jgi:hypothetical protein
MKTITPTACGIAAVLSLGSAAADAPWDEDELEAGELPFSEAELFFELNDTDGDLGIHSLIDGEPWSSIEIRSPANQRILSVRNSGELRDQGLTEIFFESSEPPFDELDPLTFFARFPEGTYEAEGRTLDGLELDSELELTHVMPAPPVTFVNGAAQGNQCDDEEPGYDAPAVSPPVTISWLPVTTSHPDTDGAGAGVNPPVPVTIHNYEVVVEAEFDIGDDEFTSVLSIILPPDTTAFDVPASITSLSDSFKYEVLARERSFNQTAVESCYEID